MKRAVLILLLLSFILSACTSDAITQRVFLAPHRDLGKGIYRVAGLDGVRGVAWSPKDNLLIGLAGRQPTPPIPDCIPFPWACWVATWGLPDFNSELIIVDLQAEQRHRILKTGLDEKIISNVFWLADGEHIAYTVEPFFNTRQNSGTWSVGIDGNNDHRFSESTAEYSIDRSPDGRRMWRIDGTRLYLRDTSASAEQEVFHSTDAATDITSVSWAPDGRHLLFVTAPMTYRFADTFAHRPLIYIVNVETGDTQKIEWEIPATLWAPRLSPSTRLVAFGVQQQPDFRSRLELQELPTGCRVELPLQDVRRFAWSFDGSMLLVELSDGNWVVNLAEFLGPKFAATGSVCP